MDILRQLLSAPILLRFVKLLLQCPMSVGMILEVLRVLRENYKRLSNIQLSIQRSLTSLACHLLRVSCSTGHLVVVRPCRSRHLQTNAKPTSSATKDLNYSPCGSARVRLMLGRSLTRRGNPHLVFYSLMNLTTIATQVMQKSHHRSKYYMKLVSLNSILASQRGSSVGDAGGQLIGSLTSSSLRWMVRTPRRLSS